MFSDFLKYVMFVQIDVVVVLFDVGQFVVFLIEIVYGFGGDVVNFEVVVCIYVVKGWFVNYLVIVYLLLGGDFGYWVDDLLVDVYVLIDVFWLGLLMLILKCYVCILDVVSGGQDLVGLCCLLYLVVQVLLVVFGVWCGGYGGVVVLFVNWFGYVSLMIV